MSALLVIISSVAQPVLEASAFEFHGDRQIKLLETNGKEHTIGSISFFEDNGDISYSITWHDEVFEEHFLSMRPFKCFEGSEKYWCRVPYPYEIKRVVAGDDLTDLEYDMLFIWKGATEYGINMWNGVYYDLQVEEDRIVGTLNEMDMEKLGVPPDQGNLRPIRDVDLEPGDSESHWLPTLIIK